MRELTLEEIATKWGNNIVIYLQNEIEKNRKLEKKIRLNEEFFENNIESLEKENKELRDHIVILEKSITSLDENLNKSKKIQQILFKKLFILQDKDEEISELLQSIETDDV